MKLEFCAVCGTTNDLQQHHIEPVVLSGVERYKKKKYNERTQLKNATGHDCFSRLFDLGVISDDESLTVCSYHHNILHGMIKFQKMEHNKLIKEGMKRAQANGKVIGRPTNVNEKTLEDIKRLTDEGYSVTKIVKKLKIGVGSYYKLVENKNEI